MPNKKLICMTPVKNEAWILDRFLKCASLWADHIIVLDQMSTDNTALIAKSFEKVIYKINDDKNFSEISRSRKLYDAAREIGEGNILIFLDADEIISSEFWTKNVINSLQGLNPGTVLAANLVNLCADFNRCWEIDRLTPMGYIDDGTELVGDWIHSSRVPLEGKPFYTLGAVKLLHYQFVDWERMESKHRWYQLEEKIRMPKKSAVAIFARYSHMYRVPQFKDLSSSYMEHYEKNGIDMTGTLIEKHYWWDDVVEEKLRDIKVIKSAKYLDIFDGLKPKEGMWSPEALKMLQKITSSRSRVFIVKLLWRVNAVSKGFWGKAIEKILSIFI